MRAFSEIALTPFDVALSVYERRRLTSPRPSRLPIVLIVGAPRSGTTLVYQVLSRFLCVSYLTNLSALFPRSPISASVLFRPLLHRRDTDYHSYYGNTAGLGGPNDGFHVWNRWLGSDRYRVPEELAETTTASMRTFFDVWLSTFNLPFLNKNNRNAEALPLLASALPNAYFIEVRRDPIKVVQSLITARLRIQGNKRFGWGLLSRDQDGSDPLGYVDDICAQVMAIDRNLAAARRDIAADRYDEVSYEEFCADPHALIEHIAARIPRLEIDREAMRAELKPFRMRSRVAAAPGELERIRRCLALNSESPASVIRPAIGKPTGR